MPVWHVTLSAMGTADSAARQTYAGELQRTANDCVLASSPTRQLHVAQLVLYAWDGMGPAWQKILGSPPA